MMETNFTELRNMSDLDSRTRADVKQYEAEIRESDIEQEKLEILSKKKGEQANERSDSESESQHEGEYQSGLEEEIGSSVR